MQRKPEPELMDLPDEASVYAHADFVDVNAAFVHRLLELVGKEENQRVVDLGTGPGDMPVRIAQSRPTWRITAVDGSEAMLRIARRTIESANLENCIRLLHADVKSTGLPNGAFDVVTGNSILHHIPDPLALWREIVRLAKPGAVIFLRDLMRPDSEEAARRLVELHAFDEPPLLREEFYRFLLAVFTPQEIRGQLDSLDLVGWKIEPSSDRHVDVYAIAG